METVVSEQNEMRILDVTGDTKLKWDPNIPEEVEAARKMFNEMTKTKRYLAFSVNKKDAGKGEQIREFDPSIKAMILSPALVGG